MKEKQLEFVTFVIGSVAERLKTSAADVYRMLKEASIISDYLVPDYDVLHTFSCDYIVDDVIDYMKEKGVYSSEKV